MAERFTKKDWQGKIMSIFSRKARERAFLSELYDEAWENAAWIPLKEIKLLKEPAHKFSEEEIQTLSKSPSWAMLEEITFLDLCNNKMGAE